MSSGISEKRFEDAIECALLDGGPDACPGQGWLVGESPASAYGSSWPPGGWRRRASEEYDRTRCLVPRDVLDFVLATQPKEWSRLAEHYGAEVKERFLARVATEVEKRGVLDVLRLGIKDAGCKFALVYFRPSTGLNPEVQRLHAANLFAVVRQAHFSTKSEQSFDVVLCLNGLPLFTAELKNPLTGQSVQDAVRQYARRDPREPLLSFRRCLAHFAVDPDLVYVTTRLSGPTTTRFLPFNQGRFGGAGNPPVPPTRHGYATAYLWEQVWARDSVLDLVQRFVHEIEEEDDEGRKTGRRLLLFPRYHQLDAVRRLVRDARERGPGQNYLVQHSAGSGKSNSIAWLAHQLSVLHDAKDRRVFDSIVVVTDRRVLDRQLQRTVRAMEQTLGLVENIDTTSRQLKEALESGKTIIVTTLQKFPVIAKDMSALPGRQFAVIVDEAHSSQSGESTKDLKRVLAAPSLEAAAAAEADEPEDDEDRIVAAMKARGRLANVSTFAFTATPKAKTLELFGRKTPSDGFEAFSLYSMRQAIEEGFILDVLENYTTYKAYWRLLKTVADDPHYDRQKATYLLRSFVDLHEHAIRKKVEILVEHFHASVAHRIAGQAKAMVVTRSRLHAVRTKQAIDAYLKEKGYPYRALVAFSGEVNDGGVKVTEVGMNGFPEAQTAKMFRRPECRFLVVAEKFQTGFDEPLLHTMYVDKKLSGVHAVQTLSRINRTHPGKEETAVLDFVNEADDIRKAFEPYYERTILSEATDPNRLYDLERTLRDFHVFDDGDLRAVATVEFSAPDAHKQPRIYSLLDPVRDRVLALPEDERRDVRKALGDYVRLYAFLSQVLQFADADLERLYVLARYLLRRLPAEAGKLPVEIQQSIDMESYRVQPTHRGKIALERGENELSPMGADGSEGARAEVEVLSQIIRELNERFGTDFTEEDRVFIRHLEQALATDPALAASVRSNTRENARLTFDHVVTDRLQDMVDTNFTFYKRVTDDPQFAKFFLDWLFERFRATTAKPPSREA